MPKDCTNSSERDMLASAGKAAPAKTMTRRAASGTLTEMWMKKPSTSSKRAAVPEGKAVTMKSSDAANPEEGSPAPSEVSTSKSSSSKQAEVIARAILDTLEDDTMGESWKIALALEFQKPYFLKLKKFLLAEHMSHTIYPSTNNIYSWSKLTPLDQVKVVVLGQDPYHDVNQAHGLSFSVLMPTKPPPSLKNIYKQLETDIPGFKAPMTGDLSAIARQGVLWLNTSLTVRAHKAGSHSRQGWEIFTAQAIRAILQRKGNDQPGVVFMAWGLPAQKTFNSIGVDEKKHLLLKSAHPSPLSAHRGFLGNGHFKQANEWLAKKYGKGAEIDWTVISAK
ncbi:hypothetical protein HYPSUDRAFT_36970 [Hypholoma sublateritium FD-334 SS-4]|uniref:Uracil-DNA glycosylase n=1 Tax=Hypholoma sublateritium (strain FD-334 SS-4) TaxID=945553 RepID=A0A0D2LEY3_HYPSF|nr:hypothetical protein HYPSUDRAFT_36970 [Hypholoma sublateritium FD-334 SS-4]